MVFEVIEYVNLEILESKCKKSHDDYYFSEESKIFLFILILLNIGFDQLSKLNNV